MFSHKNMLTYFQLFGESFQIKILIKKTQVYMEKCLNIAYVFTCNINNIALRCFYL